MFITDPISVFLGVSAAVSATFGAVLIYHGQARRVSLVYAVNIVMILWWVWSMFFYRGASPETVLFWAKMLYISASFIASSFFYFTFIFPEPEKGVFKRKFLPIFTPNIVLAALITFSPWIISDAAVQIHNENTIVFGQWYWIYVLYILFFFLYGFIRIFRKYLKAIDKTERTQIIFLLIGYAVGANISFATNLLAPWFGYFGLNWVGQTTSVLMIVFTTYAIVRHHLFDARIITTELLTFFLWILLLSRTLLASSLQEQLIEGVVFLLTLILGIFLIRSVIHEVRAREEIERLAKDLEKANKRLRELDQLKSEFLSIASHQMRSPLTAIKGYASLILEGSYGAVSETVRQAVDKMGTATEGMISVVENFLNVSRIEQGRMKYDLAPQDVRALVHETVDELLPIAEKKNLTLSFKPGIANNYVANIDSDKLKQVFINLIDNSIKYTEKGSVTVSVEKKEKNITVTVNDTGVGMTENDIARLFKKFSRARDANEVNVKGTGLGLYVAKEIVEAHKGTVEARSNGKGGGSTFTVTIPAGA